MRTKGRTIAELAATAVVGFIAFLAPTIASPPATPMNAPLSPLVRAAVEHVSLANIVGLAVAGLFAGMLCRANWALLGLATMACFPLVSIAEMLKDPTSHNLFPIEFGMYAVFAVPAVGAAKLGRALQHAGPRPRTA